MPTRGKEPKPAERQRIPGARGLSSSQGIGATLVDAPSTRASRTVSDILRSNLLTRFNAILGALLVVVAFVGPPQDGLFGAVLALNAAMAIAEELRAKAALDRLAILTKPLAHVRRNGSIDDLDPSALAVGDLLELWPGDQVCADGILLEESSLELDESLLTGEAEPVRRAKGDEVRSGSFVVAGKGTMKATAVGPNAYAQRLQLEARRFRSDVSELQAATNRILRVVSWLIGPIGALLATSELVRSHVGASNALRATVAGVGAMVPEGLVLLTTLAFALGALRLARRQVLVQRLPAIEGLARVDVVCIDKTGTLTLPGMRLEQVVPLEGHTERAARSALGALAASDPAPNATMRAIAERCDPPSWRPTGTVAFSSATPWSAASFEGQGTFFLGASSALLKAGRGALSSGDRALLEELAGAGKRVLLLARSTVLAPDSLPADLEPVAAAVLAEELRSDAAEVMSYLRDEGVGVKILSGDDPRTAAAIARRVGLEVDRAADAAEVPEDPEALLRLLSSTNVVGRVRPEQKRAVVAALQAGGHTVAMVGDGVNDVPALKQADVALAMGSGSQASRAVASIVLLGSDIAQMPRIVAEGRRAIANVEHVASLFLTKTVYASILALLTGAVGVAYPFFPRQLTVVSALTIGIPGFLLSLARRAPRAHGLFLRRVLSFSLPSGVAAALAVLGSYGIARVSEPGSAATARAAATTALLAVALGILTLLVRPLTLLRVGLVALMAGGGALAWLLPFTRHLFDLALPTMPLLLTTAGVVAAALIGLILTLHRLPLRAAADSPRPPERDGGEGQHAGRRGDGRAP
jgi:cation-transporting ATPase E